MAIPELKKHLCKLTIANVILFLLCVAIFEINRGRSDILERRCEALEKVLKKISIQDNTLYVKRIELMQSSYKGIERKKHGN